MNIYIVNKESEKLEMHIDKGDYARLDDNLKKEIRSNFLFSRSREAWVSRAKFPNLRRAEEVAKKIGLTNNGSIGEQLTYAEKMDRKAQRAERRAEGYDCKAESALENGKALQKPINNMHGDIAFFTQPNINSSSGRAFSRKRDRMFAAWERGFDEFKKSEYYVERARIARKTAEQTRPTDKGFIDRRIKEAEKTIRAQKKNLNSYHATLQKIESGEVVKRYNGDILKADMVQEWIEEAEMMIENAISKSIYYHECMDSVGGVMFSKENIKVGYIVEIARWGKCKILGTGKVNVTYEILTGGAIGLCGKAAYAEIKNIISKEVVNEISHPFKVGEVYTVEVWNGEKREPKEYTIIKITNDRVTLKSGTDRAINRKPRKFRDGSNAYAWAIGITDGFGGTIYKKEG